MNVLHVYVVQSETQENKKDFMLPLDNRYTANRAHLDWLLHNQNKNSICL